MAKIKSYLMCIFSAILALTGLGLGLSLVKGESLKGSNFPLFMERDSFGPDIDTTENTIVFWSDSDFLKQCIPDDKFEIWLYDTKSFSRYRFLLFW